jgi:hypothetical protein
MDLVDEYRKRAEECRLLAARAISEHHKSLMLGMADTWDIIARQRVAYLRDHPDEADPIALPWRDAPPGEMPRIGP